MRRDLERQASRSIRWSFGFWVLFFTALVVQHLGPQLFGIGPSVDADVGEVMAAALLLAVNCVLIAIVLQFFGRSLNRKPMAFDLITPPQPPRRRFR